MCVFAKFNHLSDMLSSPAIYFRPQNFRQIHPKKIGLLGWSSTGRRQDLCIAVVDGGGAEGEREKHPLLVVFSLKLYGTPMFWSRVMKAGIKLSLKLLFQGYAFCSFCQNPHKWQRCQAFNHLGSCIFSSKELDFSSA